MATPDMLDQLISNSLALRLDDPQFAGEVYRDIRDQAVLAQERWHASRSHGGRESEEALQAFRNGRGKSRAR